MAADRRRPLVGLTPDVGQTAARPGRPSAARYELKQAYADAVLAAGGLPIILPYSDDADLAAEAASRCDALVITGGAFDIPPELYAQAPHARLGETRPRRTQFEQLVLRHSLARGVPVLGVCGGMQLLAVELGGTLWQDLGAQVPQALDHEQKNDPREPGHAARVVEGSRLRGVVGRDLLEVNSTHHQAVRDTGRAAACAVAPDGVIEAIELPGDAFVLGVQWHPELLPGAEHLRLYQALVAAALR